MGTPLPQQSSSSSSDEESQWVSVEDRRRRRVAFEEAAKRVMRYLTCSKDFKVGVTELKEQLERSEEAGVSIRRIAQQEGTRTVKIIFEMLSGMYCQSCQMERAVEMSGCV